MARGEFSIIIAGLAVGVAGAEDLPGLAAAYVLILAVAGPVAAKLAAPGRRRNRPTGSSERREPPGSEPTEVVRTAD